MATAAVGVVVPAGPTRAQEVPWEAVRLRPLVAGELTSVQDINDDGISVGASGSTPVRWSGDGDPVALPLPAGCGGGVATAVNDDLQTVAGYATCGFGTLGVVWTIDAVHPLDLDLTPEDVSSSGVVVGAKHDGPAQHAAAMVLGGQRIDLESIHGQTTAHAISDGYLVVGEIDGMPGLPPTTAIGWYGPYVFPLTDRTDPTAGIDANAGGAILLQVGGGDPYGVIVVPGGGEHPLSRDGAADIVVAMNESGTVLGYRTTTGLPVTGALRTGGLYLADQFIPLGSLVEPATATAFGFHGPRALNRYHWVVGTEDDGSSWIVRPVPAVSDLPVTGLRTG